MTLPFNKVILKYLISFFASSPTVVWETAVSPRSTCGNNAIMAIGFAVFVAQLVLIPIDGCSINPARSFGPAVISHLRDCPKKTNDGLKDMWVMIVGPLAGGAFASLLAVPMRANSRFIEDSDKPAIPNIKVAAEITYMRSLLLNLLTRKQRFHLKQVMKSTSS